MTTTENNIKWLMTPNSIVVRMNGTTHSVLKENPNYNKVLAALKGKNYKVLPRLMSIATAISEYSNGQFVVKNGEVFVADRKVGNFLGAKILEFADAGLDFKPLVRFADKVARNPSGDSVEDLFRFLQHNNQPITENGNFIAYKRVDSDFLDTRTRTMDNSPGNVVRMKRSDVDQDRNRTCAAGLHVANWDYAAHHYNGSNGVMLSVEVSPFNVCAVPTDYNNGKMRVSRYKVRGVVTEPSSAPLMDSMWVDITSPLAIVQQSRKLQSRKAKKVLSRVRAGNISSRNKARKLEKVRINKSKRRR